MGWLWPCKSKAKSIIFVVGAINNLITIQSLRENLEHQPTILILLLVGQYGKASVWDFPVATSFSIIKGWFSLATES